MTRPLLIIGASVRAAAMSALRAGFKPFCLDLFADIDLTAICPVQRIESGYPDAMVALCRQQSPAPWIYTGGLETRPDLVEQIARDRPLLGNDGNVLRQVRDPFLVHNHLIQEGIPVPAVSKSLPAVSSHKWLVKARNHVGGSGIHFLSEKILRQSEGRGPPVYYQQWIEGKSAAAIFVASGLSTRLVGLTSQLVGESWLRAKPFRYCGSIGPLSVSKAVQQNLERLGQSLAERFHLRGLFGIDGIFQGETFWPVEINPRYTASVEVIELATDWCALHDHWGSFTNQLVARSPGPRIHSPLFDFQNRMGQRKKGTMVGKAILYAAQNLVIQPGQPWEDQQSAIADIPAPGTQIELGQPILSVFSSGDSESECWDRLQCQVDALEQSLYFQES